MKLNLEFAEPMLVRWRELMPRERLIIAVAGTVLLLLIVYSAVWLPWHRELARLRVSVPLAQEQLELMRNQATLIQRLRANRSAAPANVNLLTLVEQTAAAAGLKQTISRLEQDGVNGVRISLDETDFNTLLGWLDTLQTQGAQVENASFDARPTTGVVNARLLLRAAGK
jgi:general secretion pathway protein M